MKISLKLLCICKNVFNMIIIAAFFLSLNDANAQGKRFITGILLDVKSSQPVSFATVSLILKSDSTVRGGAGSNESGQFNIGPVANGKYVLHVSNIGYKPATRDVEVSGEEITDAGIILLEETAIMLNELVVTGERGKARAESDRTTYNITEKMVTASGTGTDLLNLIPGVRTDLMQNISLEGSTSIMIYVDGKERDKSFISQLNPEQIDKIEIISTPPSNFDGNLTGAINIILKKDRESGISGQMLAEIPTSASVMYLFPTYSLNYGFKKLNFYTSYNGEIISLDQEENISRELWVDRDTTRLISNQVVRQKSWSHRFHYGFDYFLDGRNQFNFYAYYNTWSQELDGIAYFNVSGINNDSWQAKKDDNDKNTSAFYSLYYKHTFDKKEATITSDISSYRLVAENSTNYTLVRPGDETAVLKNAVRPKQDMLSVKVDFSTLLLNRLNISTGFKSKFQLSQNTLSAFEYRENIFALYGNFAWKLEKFDLGGGLRVEKSGVDLEDKFAKSNLAFFPYASVKYNLTRVQNLRIAYTRSVRRPNLFQLNPCVTANDPWSETSGNPFLKPEFLGSVFLEHSAQFNGNYLATRLLFNRADNVINNLMYINDAGKFETRFYNPGHMSQFGAQVSGTFKISFLTLSPFLKVYNLHTSGNDLAKEHSIGNKTRTGLESGLSTIGSFKHDMAFSIKIQYNTSQYDIQSRSFSDVIYFLSIEKTFRKKLKAGVVSAIPFTRSFTYMGSDFSGPDFHSLYEGEVIMSKIPLWFRVGYQFSSGKSRTKISRDKEEVENLRKNGF